ncbi:MAG: head GIN domain-containing protein [Hymenobacter sp.]
MMQLLRPALLGLSLLVPALAPALDPASPQLRAVAPFHAITVGTGIVLELTAGPGQQVEVSAATTDFRDHILTIVAAGVLSIHYENPADRGYQSSNKRSREGQQLRVRVTADQLTSLAAGSGAVVTATGNVAAPDFQLDVSSGASCQATELTPNVLIVRQSGASTVTLGGRAPRFDLRAIGGSTFKGENLLTDRSQVEASNGSTVRLAVRESLLAEASSGASVRYLGAPTVTKTVSGGGTVGR